MWNQIDYEQYRKELIEQAQKDHLVREILNDSSKSTPALAWVGKRIAEFGAKLMATEQYENSSDVSLN